MDLLEPYPEHPIFNSSITQISVAGTVGFCDLRGRKHYIATPVGSPLTSTARSRCPTLLSLYGQTTTSLHFLSLQSKSRPFNSNSLHCQISASAKHHHVPRKLLRQLLPLRLAPDIQHRRYERDRLRRYRPP